MTSSARSILSNSDDLIYMTSSTKKKKSRGEPRERERERVSERERESILRPCGRGFV
jgi:hypothetical protein